MPATCIIGSVLALDKHDYTSSTKFLSKSRLAVFAQRSINHQTQWDVGYIVNCTHHHLRSPCLCLWASGAGSAQRRHSHGCLEHSLMLPVPGTLVIWAVALFFHKETAHIPVCACANKPVFSINTVLGESQSESTMFSVGNWSNKEKSLFFVSLDGRSFTWADPAWACLCLLLLCIFLFHMVSQMPNIIVYTREVTVFVLPFS